MKQERKPAGEFLRVIVFMTLWVGIPWGGVYRAEAEEPVANYNIQVSLNAASRTLEGQALLIWRNPSSRPVKRLCFHLYMNAFRHNRTYLLGRLGPRFYRRWAPLTEEKLGSIEFTHVVTSRGNLVSVRYDEDGTIAWLELPQAIFPGETLQLQYSFETKLPVLMLRTGYAGDFYMVAQWFPKIARMENNQWHCEPFHAYSEFYSDFGTYNVSIQVPSRFIVGATGQLMDEHTQGEWRIYRFLGEKIHDFAWAAYPDFRILESRVGAVRVRIYYPPGHGSGARRTLEVVTHALKWFERNIAPYPYNTLTIIDPPLQGSRAGGMEYPTLIVTGYGLNFPNWLRMPEILATHEFSHQYWYGVVATDEPHHAWMDEGLATYSEIRLMNDRLGNSAGYLPLLGTWGGYEEWFQGRPMMYFKFDPPEQPARSFHSFSSYVANSFIKPALILASLERQVGASAMDRFLKAYYSTYQFRHPTPEDFINLLISEIGRDAGQFFNRYIQSSGVPDYQVRRVRCRLTEPFIGYRGYGEDREFKGEEREANRYSCQVDLRRYGNPGWPVSVKIVLTSGDVITFIWNAEKSWHRWRRDDLVAPVERVFVDPDMKFLLDPDRMNNGWIHRTPVQLRGAKNRLLIWIMHLMLLIPGLG